VKKLFARVAPAQKLKRMSQNPWLQAQRPAATGSFFNGSSIGGASRPCLPEL
jgi:hypothetical protein